MITWDIEAVKTMPLPPEDWPPPEIPANAEEYVKVLIWVKAQQHQDAGLPWSESWDKARQEVLEEMTTYGVLQHFGAFQSRQEGASGDEEPGTDLLNYVVEVAHENPGVVVSEDAARTSGCIGYQLGGKSLVFSRGVVGALSEEQQALYCPEILWREGPAVSERVEAMREAVETCKVQVQDGPPEQKVTRRLQCLQDELRRRGQKGLGQQG